MCKKDLVVLFVLLGALVAACQLLSIPWLIVFGAFEIVFAVWWGRRPCSKVRVTHRRSTHSTFLNRRKPEARSRRVRLFLCSCKRKGAEKCFTLKNMKAPESATKKEVRKLVLLDAHAILHRAYHALPDFASSKGEPTGALYGLSTMLIKIIDELKPDYLIAAYDLPKPTYRHEAYKDYKAGRVKADDELVAQMKRSREVFTAFNIPIYDKEGFEADDMLGTIVEQMKKRSDIDIVIASGDMDTLQLVDDKKYKSIHSQKRHSR